MREFLTSSSFFPLLLSIAAYLLGVLIQKKTKLAVMNPLLLSIIFTIAVLVLTDVDYETYYDGSKLLAYFLTPATVCLAIPLYQRLNVLKENAKAILIGILSGVVTSLLSIFLMSKLFGFTEAEFAAFLPKSITTAIGISLSEEYGGIVTLTVAAIIVTGVFGNVAALGLCKLFRVTDPVARGIAIGTCSHAIGTSKAMEIGETEGAVSSLSIAVAGLLTVILAPIFIALF